MTLPPQGSHNMDNSREALPCGSIELLTIRPTCTSVACKSCLALDPGGVGSKLLPETQAGTLSPMIRQKWT